MCDTLVSRFQRPVPVVPWSGVEGGREVECAQEVTGVERLLPWGPEVRGEEDCLVINVYTPSLDGAWSVMVFIHGGGYYAGGGGSSLTVGELFPQGLELKQFMVLTIL